MEVIPIQKYKEAKAIAKMSIAHIYLKVFI